MFMKAWVKKKSSVSSLKKNSFFTEVFNNGVSFAYEDIVLKASFSAPSEKDIFIGYAVSKIPSFNAVKKNRIKRLLKQGVIENLSFVEKNDSPGNYILLFVGPSLPENSKNLFINVLSVFKKSLASKKNT